VLVVDQISGDGESNWLEGVLLVMLYALIGVLFFNLPG
jgi:Ca2+:H+ antiporter